MIHSTTKIIVELWWRDNIALSIAQSKTQHVSSFCGETCASHKIAMCGFYDKSAIEDMKTISIIECGIRSGPSTGSSRLDPLMNIALLSTKTITELLWENVDIISTAESWVLVGPNSVGATKTSRVGSSHKQKRNTKTLSTSYLNTFGACISTMEHSIESGPLLSPLDWIL